MAVMNYRTQDGLADYGFSIEFEPNRGWRVYIVFQPYEDSQHLPHQSLDSTGRCYVAWPSKLNSLGDGKTVASLWAEFIHRYRQTQRETRNQPNARVS